VRGGNIVWRDLTGSRKSREVETTGVKILTIMGARPQFIKAAPVSAALAALSIEEVLVHTGQHFDDNMSSVFFRELGLNEPHHHLGIGGGSHGVMTGQMLAACEAVMLERRPDLVLVYGDTNSTLAGALAAAKLHIGVAHVEAGLRSFNRRMPEEINRVLTDHVSRFLFCPTGTAVTNLAEEGIHSGVLQTGDVMYDAVLKSAQAATEKSRILQRLNLRDGGYAVATVHRAENTDDEGQLRAVFTWLAARASELPVVMPLHPRTRKALERAGLEPQRLVLIPPWAISTWPVCFRGQRRSLPIPAACRRKPIFTGCLASPCGTRPNGSRPWRRAGTACGGGRTMPHGATYWSMATARPQRRSRPCWWLRGNRWHSRPPPPVVFS
jgi:UDP-GlcNAc3NAcA epimerase